MRGGVELLSYWVIGLLGCWGVCLGGNRQWAWWGGVDGYWGVELLGYWVIGLLGYWGVELLFGRE